jgi:hypothetical protein
MFAYFDDENIKRAVAHHVEPAPGNPVAPTQPDPKWLRIDHGQ